MAFDVIVRSGWSRINAVWIGATLGFGLLIAACPGGGHELPGQPGAETGPCLDNQCLPGLQCLSNLCVDPSGNSGGTTGGATMSDSGDADASGSSDSGTPSTRAVDILVVMDNTGSMGEEQGILAQSIEALIGPLDDAGVDWRLGVTTTDNGNPWCMGTTPEAGALRASSCRSRQSEFVFMGAQTLDYTQEGCLDVCAYDGIALDEPWVETVGGVANTPVETVDALSCILPQGINGCGFEQHLESMHKAIARWEIDSEESFGFRQDGSLLVVLFVTDEVDCSHNQNHQAIFLPEDMGGTTIFWSLPDEGSPTSAVCWNAGVACSGSGTPYDECHAVDLDVTGSMVSGEDAATDAVLRPLSRYVAALDPGRTMVVAINGVAADGSVTYQDSVADPTFQDDFGIGPGCTSAAGTAVPPVRIRELTEAFSSAGEQSLFSVCEASYSGALGTISQQIIDRLP